MRGGWRPVVSTSWLAQRLSSPDSRIQTIDATWALPNSPFVLDGGASAQSAFEAGPRIPGARFWDLDRFSDDTAAPGVPHNLPNSAQFANALRECGLAPDCSIVAYDQFGVFSSPRLYFTLRHFGWDRVAVLDGGLPAWIDCGHEVEYGAVKAVERGAFTSQLGANERLRQWRMEDVRQWLRADPASRPILVDARSKPRFDGSVPDPRGLRSGHIPGSLSLPFTDVLEPRPEGDQGRPGGVWRGAHLKSQDQLRQLFEALGVEPARPVALTCGSGLTAATLALALDVVASDGNDSYDVSLYDGSWSEYAKADDMPLATTSPH